MKITIRIKLFLIMFAVIVGFVMSVLLLNGTVLEEYYFNRKQTALLEGAERTVQHVRLNEEISQEGQANISSLSEIEEELGCRVLIVKREGANFRCLYNSVIPHNTSDSGAIEYPVVTPQQFILEHESRFLNQKHEVVVTENDSLGAKALGVYSAHRTTDGSTVYLCLRSYYSDIGDSIAIFNRFCLILGAILLLLGAIIVIVIANMIANPVVSVNRATARMREMDFTTRLPVGSTDEIGELAANVNALSDELEQAIGKLTVANEQLARDIELKTSIDEMRKTFISNVSHELKTPLSLIMGYAEALQLDNPQDVQREYCDIITDESKKMNALVVNILRLSQMDEKAVMPQCSTFSIVRLIHECLRGYRLVIEEKGIKTEVLADRDYEVYADYEMTLQAIGNYLSNAFHYVSGDVPVIRITVCEADVGVRVAVYNSGSSIPEEQLPLIWDSFYKVDKARTRAYGGHGLGLAIVKRVISAHGCEVGVQNVDGGIEFWFELPIKQE